MTIWTMTTPVLSTAHVPSEPAMRSLGRDENNGNYRYGCFVWIDNRNERDVERPDWLKVVADWCWANYGDDCTWVRFDQDGDTVDELSQWSW